MRKRPMCLVFLGLIVLIVILDRSGISVGVPPDVKTASELMRTYDGNCTVTGVISDRNKTEKGYSYTLKDAVLSHRRNKYEIGRVRINSTDKRIETGTGVRIYGRLSFYEPASNPGGFDARKYYMGEYIYSSMSLKSFTVLVKCSGFRFSEAAASLRERVSEMFTEAMGKNNGGILSAMITGDRSGIDEETRINYSVSGLSHLLAISGLHVGIIGAAILFLLLTIGMPRLPASVVSSAFLILYSIFAGGRESTVRAALMFAAASAAVFFRKSYDTLSALSLAGIILICINPYRIFRAGFILSFTAVAGLAVIYPSLKEFAAGTAVKNSTGTGKIKKLLTDGALVWLSVSLATVPVILWNYSEIPVYQAAANILLVPLTEMILLFGISGAAVSFVLPFIGKWLFFIPNCLIGLQEGAGELLRFMPGAVWITGKPGLLKLLLYYGGLAILLIVMRIVRIDRKKCASEKTDGEKKTNKTRAVIPTDRKKLAGVARIACVMMALIFIRVPNSFEVTALNVGQGDCTVFTSEKGKAFMIDGGSSSLQKPGSNVILPFLKSKGIPELEGIFITHNDADHVNGIIELLEMSERGLTVIRAKRVFMPWWMKEDESCAELIRTAQNAGAEVLWLKAGDRIRSTGIDIEVLFPGLEDEYAGNDGSLVLGLKYGCFSGLFTGDLGGEAEEQLTKRLGRYSILKAGHHGSAGSTSSEFLEAADPDFCIISAPRISSYGHPAPETVERLKEANVPWLQTGISGALSFKVRGSSIIIKPYSVYG